MTTLAPTSSRVAQNSNRSDFNVRAISTPHVGVPGFWGSGVPGFSEPEAPQNQNSRTSTSELQHLRTPEPQNPRTSEPQNLRTLEPFKDPAPRFRNLLSVRQDPSSR